MVCWSSLFSLSSPGLKIAMFKPPRGNWFSQHGQPIRYLFSLTKSFQGNSRNVSRKTHIFIFRKETRTVFSRSYSAAGSIVGADNYVRSPRPALELPSISVGELLMKRLEQYGDLEAVVDIPTGRRLTFRQLRDVVVRATSGMAKLGIKKGDPVLVVAGNSLEYVVLCVAVNNLGAIFSPTNPSCTPAELSRAIDICQTGVIVADQSAIDVANKACEGRSNVKTKISIGEADGWLPFSRLMEDDGSAFTKPVDVNPKEDIAFLPYSSGTTGLPKAVMLTHYNIVANMLQFGQTVPAESGVDKVLGYMPFYHAYGLNGKVLYCIYHGTSLHIIPRFTEKLLDVMTEERITILHLVPPICLFIIKHPALAQYDLSTIRRALCAAAPVGKSQIEEFVDKTGIHEFSQGYGMTEVSPVATMDSAPGRLGSSGQPLANTVVKVVCSNSGDSLGPDQTGEICIQGPQVMKGYLGNEDATMSTLKDEWLFSGDIGHFDSEGYFYITDRVKELIKFKGHQVAPAELEAILLTHPSIQDAAVIGIDDEYAGELPRAFVVKKPNSTTDLQADDVINFITEQVSPHKRLRGGVEFVTAIPKSPSGKILRRVLKESVK